MQNCFARDMGARTTGTDIVFKLNQEELDLIKDQAEIVHENRVAWMHQEVGAELIQSAYAAIIMVHDVDVQVDSIVQQYTWPAPARK